MFLQTVTQVDPLSNWLQVILQLGALGLLAIILLYIYPRESKAGREEREQRDREHAAILAKQQEKFDDRNDKLVGAIEKQTASMVEWFKEEAKLRTDAVKELKEHRQLPGKGE